MVPAKSCQVDQAGSGFASWAGPTRQAWQNCWPWSCAALAMIGSDADSLRASAGTDVTRLGGAIAARVRQAMGHLPIACAGQLLSVCLRRLAAHQSVTWNAILCACRGSLSALPRAKPGSPGCIGPKAAYQSIKSVVNANDYLSRDPDAPEGRYLGVEVLETKRALPGISAPGSFYYLSWSRYCYGYYTWQCSSKFVPSTRYWYRVRGRVPAPVLVHQ